MVASSLSRIVCGGVLALATVRPALSDCVSFRQTSECSADGEREPSGDRACNETVPCDVDDCPPGYCECEDGRIVNPVDCHVGSHTAFDCASQCGSSPASLCSQFPGPDAGGMIQGTQLVLGNGYVCAVLELRSMHISELKGDFFGKGDYGKNVISPSGIRLEREDGDGSKHHHSASDIADAELVNGTAMIQTSGQLVEETWTLMLSTGSRSLTLSTEGHINRDFTSRVFRLDIPIASPSIYGLFDTRVVQNKFAAAGSDYYGSTDGLGQLYSLGGNMSVALRWHQRPQGIVLRSSGSGMNGNSGVQAVLIGSVPKENEWSAGWETVQAATFPAHSAWYSVVELAPNSFNFPVQGPSAPSGDATTVAHLV